MRNRYSRLLALAVVLVLLAGLATGCRSATSSSAPVDTAAVSNSRGMDTEPLIMDESVPGVSLATATAKSNDQIVLPDAAVVGNVKKALIDQTPGLAREEIGIAVAYSSGVRFYFKPLPPEAMPDYDELLAQTGDVAKYEDGRARPFEIVVVDGVKVAVRKSGTQVTMKGRGVATETQVQWNAAEGTYILRSDSGPTEQLLGIAKGLIARGAK